VGDLFLGGRLFSVHWYRLWVRLLALGVVLFGRVPSSDALSGSRRGPFLGWVPPFGAFGGSRRVSRSISTKITPRLGYCTETAANHDREPPKRGAEWRFLPPDRPSSVPPGSAPARLRTVLARLGFGSAPPGSARLEGTRPAPPPPAQYPRYRSSSFRAWPLWLAGPLRGPGR
jgi:hypothetical protein